MAYVALMGKGGELGFYVSDDKPLAAEQGEAAQFATLQIAEQNAACCNAQWPLEEGQYFAAFS